MANQYIEVNFTRPTKIYEIKLQEIDSIKENSTYEEIVKKLKEKNIKNIFADLAQPEFINILQKNGIQVTGIRLNAKKDIPF